MTNNEKYFCRAKFHKLKYGENSENCPEVEPPSSLLDDLNSDGGEGVESSNPALLNNSSYNNKDWKHSRQLLRS